MQGNNIGLEKMASHEPSSGALAWFASAARTVTGRFPSAATLPARGATANLESLRHAQMHHFASMAPGVQDFSRHRESEKETKSTHPGRYGLRHRFSHAQHLPQSVSKSRQSVARLHQADLQAQIHAARQKILQQALCRVEGGVVRGRGGGVGI